MALAATLTVGLAQAVGAAAGTPAGHGYLCVESDARPYGTYVFFRFDVRGHAVRGSVIESYVSDQAEIPMNGSVQGDRIVLRPMDGYGLYTGTLRGNRLHVSGQTPGVPIQLQCSLRPFSAWRALRDRMAPSDEPQLSTGGFLVTTAFTYSQLGENPTGTKYVTPSAAMVRYLADHQVRPPRSPFLLPPKFAYTTNPVHVLLAVSVNVNTAGNRVVMATRESNGVCWYLVRSTAPQPTDGGSSTVPMVGGDGLFASRPHQKDCDARVLPAQLTRY